MLWKWVTLTLIIKRSLKTMPTFYKENRVNEDYIHHIHFTRLSSYTIWKQNYTSGKFLEDDARYGKEGEEEDDDGKEQEGISYSNEGRFFIGQRSVSEDDKKCNELKVGVLSKHLMKLPRDASVIPYLEQWFAEKKSFPKNVIIVALTNLKRDRRYKQALEVTDFIRKKRLFEMEDVDYMYRLYLVGQVGSIQDVEECFESIPTECLTERVYNQLIAFYIGKGMVKNAENALEKLKNSGHIVSIRPYNQFMSMYRHEGHTEKALEFIKMMTASSISPDTRTYNLLLSLISKQGDPDGVLKNYKAMKDEAVAPNIVTYSLVAKAYISVGRLEEALSLAMKMKRLKGRNTHLAHDLLLTVYAEQGKGEELRKTWKEIESSNNLSARTYGIMIESLGKLGFIKEAEHLATKAEMKKMKLSGRVYNAMMDVYGRHGMIESAENLMARICNANSVTYKHLISGYLKRDQLDKAMEYLRASRNSLTYGNSKPWFDSFMLIMQNLADRGECEIAEHAFQYFTSPGSYRNTIVYNVLIKAYIKARKLTSSSSFQQRMFADGIEPDAKTMAFLAELESLHDMTSS